MPRKPTFSVISPGWRCEDYVAAWYNSLRKQRGDFQWTAYALDDHSNDKTYRRLQSLRDERVVCERTPTHKGAAYARLKLMRMCDPSSIMVMLDLDDWLTTDAFQELARAYRDPKIMATFGSYVTDKGGGVDNRLYKAEEINTNTFHRKFKFQAPPLRTFRASLVEGVTNEDMKDSQGEWYQTATDVALSWRFLWALRADQIKVIRRNLYVYRQRPKNQSAKRFDKAKVMKDLRAKYESKPLPECKRD